MIAALIDYVLHGSPAVVNIDDGYTRALIRKAEHEHTTEFFCGAGKARRVGYRKDVRAIAEREQRLAGVMPFRKRG